MIDIPYIDRQNGVFVLSQLPSSSDFESMYLKVRKKENRLYSDAEVKEFPQTFLYNLHRQEWQIRGRSLQRLIKYFKHIEGKVRILEVGCGNGWLCGHFAKIDRFEVVGLDINFPELEQAVRVFPSSNIKFCYGNLFEDILPFSSFDYLILSSSIQYFPNLAQLLNRCRQYLAAGGEIHILDSPLYNSEKEVELAKERSLRYYEGLACPEMAAHYFHHAKQELAPFDYKFLYRPGGIFSSFSKQKDSPFPWLKVVN